MPRRSHQTATHTIEVAICDLKIGTLSTVENSKYLREDRAATTRLRRVGVLSRAKFLVRAEILVATSMVQRILPEVRERLRSRTAKAEDDIRHACVGDSSSGDPLPTLPRLCASRDWRLVAGSSSPNTGEQDPRESKRMRFFRLSRTWRNRLCHLSQQSCVQRQQSILVPGSPG